MQLRDYLKQQTKELHSQLDDIVGRLDLTQVDIYRRFLSAHAEVVLPLERYLDAAESTNKPPDWSSRRRTSSLISDLNTLQTPLPTDKSVSFDNARETVLGILYVLEGSRVGGFYLSRQISVENLQRPVSFLQHGLGTAMWPEFISWLNGWSLQPSEAKKAAIAAMQVFSLYQSVFENYLGLQAEIL